MRWLFLVIGLIMTGGCQQGKKATLSTAPRNAHSSQWGFLSQFKGQFPPGFSMQHLIHWVEKGDWARASSYVNKALERYPDCAPLHLAQGFLWEARAAQGEKQADQMAHIAYRTANHADPTHPLCGYYLGKQHLTQGKAAEAQEVLVQTLLKDPDQVKSWYLLACSSYQAQDLATAYCAMRKVLTLKPNDPCYLRMAAIVFAAAGDRRGAETALTQYVAYAKDHNKHDVEYVTGRVEYWNRLHHNPSLIPTAETSPQAPSSASKGGVENIGIVLDGYILTVQEVASMQKGNNVFNAFDPAQTVNPLQVILGGVGSNSPRQLGYWGKLSTSNANGDGVNTVAGRIFGYAVSPVALNYSLNIMNASNNVASYATRPTISTLVGKPTALFSGVLLQAAPEGGSLTNIDAGDRMELTVTSIADDGLMTIDVLMGTAEPIGIGSSVSAQSLTQQLIQVQTSKLATTVKAYPGQTIALGGLKNTTKRTRETGVPLLRRLPLIQWFFSSYSEQELNTTIFYLITPRLTEDIAQKNQVNPESKSETIFKTLKCVDHNAFSVSFQPTLAHILKRLRKAPVMSAFRSRDCDVRSINARDSVVDRLKQLSYPTR